MKMQLRRLSAVLDAADKRRGNPAAAPKMLSAPICNTARRDRSSRISINPILGFVAELARVQVVRTCAANFRSLATSATESKQLPNRLAKWQCLDGPAGF